MGTGGLFGLLSWILLKNRFWLSTTPSTTKYYNLDFQISETSTNSCAYWARLIPLWGQIVGLGVV